MSTNFLTSQTHDISSDMSVVWRAHLVVAVLRRHHNGPDLLHLAVVRRGDAVHVASDLFKKAEGTPAQRHTRLMESAAKAVNGRTERQRRPGWSQGIDDRTPSGQPGRGKMTAELPGIGKGTVLGGLLWFQGAQDTVYSTWVRRSAMQMNFLSTFLGST